MPRKGVQDLTPEDVEELLDSHCILQEKYAKATLTAGYLKRENKRLLKRLFKQSKRLNECRDFIDSMIQNQAVTSKKAIAKDAPENLDPISDFFGWSEKNSNLLN